MNENEKAAARWQQLESGEIADGKFIVGVRTTGIYCLPSCRARKPLQKNVVFFDTEAGAIAFGLRPCRKCRPDAFYRGFDCDKETVARLAAQIIAAPEHFADAAALTQASGFATTKLCALFRAHYHTTPALFLRRARISAAQNLLSNPGASVTNAAFGVGGVSLSAFSAQFRAETGLAPGAFRDFVSGVNAAENGFVLSVPRIVWNTTRRVFCRDTQSTSERKTASGFTKALVCENKTVLLHLEDAGQTNAEKSKDAPRAVRVWAEADTLTPAMRRMAHQCAVRMLGFGGSGEPSAWEARADLDPLFAALTRNRRGLRVPLTADVWESVAWAIIGQQINLPFAYSLRRALTEVAGKSANAPHSRDGLTPFPSAQSIAALEVADLTARQFSRRKAEYLIDTARAVVSETFNLNALSGATPFGDAQKNLLALRGIGPWSADYILMRGAGWADCVPIGDTGIASGLRKLYALDISPDKAEQVRLMEPFAPFRSLATHHLWASLTPEETENTEG